MRKLNEKPHITRCGGQWVIEYIRADESRSPPNAPLRVRRANCGNSMLVVRKKGRSLISHIGHYHKKLVAKKPRNI
jgi:hypothetical protein